MKLADFYYNLASERIAQYPLDKRTDSKLMVLYRKTKSINHERFVNLTEYLKPNDTIILNDTKVVPARLLGNKKDTKGKVEIFLLNCVKDNVFNTLIRPAGVKENQKIVFNNNCLEAEVIDRNTVRFNTKDIRKIYQHGCMPLPPYIKRPASDIDISRYQTVYAKNKGAVAAPTAGLHFTRQILHKIKKIKVNIAYLTLHVGWATFKPVRSDDITKHQMQPEYFYIPAETAGIIKKTKEAGNRIIAIGTTTTRALETMAAKDITSGWTDLFIYPDYNFKVVNSLLTNLHLPQSTLLMLVCAFAGKDFIIQAYNEAIKNNYRFYSYGDCMLIL